MVLPYKATRPGEKTPWPSDIRNNIFLLQNCSTFSSSPTQTGKVIKAYEKSASCMTVHIKKNVVATGGDDAVFKIYDMSKCEELASGSFHTQYISSIDIHPKGSYLATASGDYTINLWDLLSLKVKAQFYSDSVVWSCKFHDTGDFLLASTDEVDTPVFSSSDYNYDALEYKDLCYINGKLYLLVRDVMKEGYNNTSYSRGALCTFTVKDNGKIESGKIIGYQKTPSYFPYTGSYDQATGSYPTITRTAYIGDGQSTFYGPVKFVARKQDELIIADDGFSIKSEDSTDYPRHTQATVSSKNAVVTYNLNKESLNFVSLDGEYFEEKYSGYFYDSGFNETNE